MKKQLFIFCFCFSAILCLKAQNTSPFPSSGNVGIGTTTPSEKLEVYGSGASIKLAATNANSLYNLKFTSNYSYTNKFTIHSGDAVIMQEKQILDVGGTGNSNSKMYLSNYYGIGFSTTSNPATKEDIDLYIAGHNNSIQKGNVGIGTTTPSEKLSINEGNINVFGYNTSRYIRFTEANLQGAFINYDGTSNVLNIGVNDINSTDTNNDVKAISIVRATGNTGIGTTTPDSKLTVKGNIHTNEVKVDLLGAVAPDYVFYKDYDLKTLKEVETYISKKGHLPNIPSAKNMEEDGIKLKEMNLKLLQKIEELTLYTIGQEKEIITLKKKTEKVGMLEKELQNQKDRLQKIEILLESKKK